MSKTRRVMIVVALILAVVVVAGRFLRQDERYLHANHVSKVQSDIQLAA